MITPEIGEIADNTFRTIFFPSVEYSNYQIRAYRKNKFDISSNFILFSTTAVLYTNKDFSPIKTIYNLTTNSYPGYQALETIFTKTNRTMVILAKMNSRMTNTFMLIYLEYDGNTTVPYKRSISVNYYSKFCSMKYLEGRIFVLFSDLIQVYGDNSSLTLVKEITIASASTESPSMALQNDLLIYCITKKCTILSIK